ncbi:hypothetical protein ACXXDK_14975 (plasmid) [Deinococcus sp. PESE-38]
MTSRALRTLARLVLSSLCLSGEAQAAGLTLALGGDINLARGRISRAASLSPLWLRHSGQT